MYSRSLNTPVVNRDYNTKDLSKKATQIADAPPLFETHIHHAGVVTLWTRCGASSSPWIIEGSCPHNTVTQSTRPPHYDSVLHDATKPQRKKEWGMDVERDHPPTCKSKTQPSAYQSDKEQKNWFWQTLHINNSHVHRVIIQSLPECRATSKQSHKTMPQKINLKT